MPNIKGGCNRYKTKKERIKILTQLRDALEYLLEKGLNPYSDPDLKLLEFKTPIKPQIQVITDISKKEEIVAIPEPLTFTSKKVINDNLNEVLINSSAKNKNSTREDFNSKFIDLVKNI